MISKSFDQKDFEKYSGQTMYGRIKEYSHSRGYGFIFTEEGKDIFVSSLQHGYSLMDLDYVFFRTKKGLEYRFFREGSPVKGDGSIPDLKAFYRELEERYYKLY